MAVDVGVVLDPERAICARCLHRFEIPTKGVVARRIPKPLPPSAARYYDATVKVTHCGCICFHGRTGEPNDISRPLPRCADAAGARTHTRRTRRVPTFALCRRLPPFAPFCCAERARIGQQLIPEGPFGALNCNQSRASTIDPVMEHYAHAAICANRVGLNLRFLDSHPFVMNSVRRGHRKGHTFREGNVRLSGIRRVDEAHRD